MKSTSPSIIVPLIATLYIEKCNSFQIPIKTTKQSLSLHDRIIISISSNSNPYRKQRLLRPLYSSTIRKNNMEVFSPSLSNNNTNAIAPPKDVDVDSNDNVMMSYRIEEESSNDETNSKLSNSYTTTQSPSLKDDLKQRHEIIWDKIMDKVGRVDEERIAFPELTNGEVPRLFSNIRYEKSNSKSIKTKVIHDSGSMLGAAALVTGTTIGAGVLGLPAATAPIGFLPSVGGLIFAWVYMVLSGLLIAELSINRIGETGRPGLGLLDLYRNILGKSGGIIGSTAYFFLHYAVMVAYIAKGGDNINTMLSGSSITSDVLSFSGSGQIIFAGVLGVSIYVAKPQLVQKVNNAFVLLLGILFLCIMGTGVQSIDITSLLAPENQHPSKVVNAFPIFFLSLVYHNIVPTIVTQLEGDKTKITQAILIGTAVPLVMFIAWNAVILGNVYHAPSDVIAQMSSGALDPIRFLQAQNNAPDEEILSTFVTVFSQLALITSIIGFVYGLNDAITDTFALPTQKNDRQQYEQVKPFIYGGIFLPPLLLSISNPDTFYQALEYGGAFGVSTLFLILPPIMIWKKRYSVVDADGDENEGGVTHMITTLPMVPGGKITLGSIWKVAGTLMLEQAADKLGVIDYLGHLVDRG